MDLLEFQNTRIYSKSEIVSLGKKDFTRCGVYFLIKNDTVIYVGQSIDINRRAREQKDKEFERLVYLEVENKYMDLMESLYIHLIKPELNTITKAPYTWERTAEILDKREDYTFDLLWGSTFHGL